MARDENVARDADAPHSDDRCFYYPDLLRAACRFCNHLPGDSTMEDIVKRFPFTATGRLTVPPHDATIYWTQDGWEDPLEDQEDPGPDADPWDAYGLFGDDEFDDCFRGD